MVLNANVHSAQLSVAKFPILYRVHWPAPGSENAELGASVRRQLSLDRPGGLNKGEFLAHRNVHRSEDETANPTIEGPS